MPKSSTEETFARTREALVSKTLFNKLNQDNNKNKQYEESMNSELQRKK